MAFQARAGVRAGPARGPRARLPEESAQRARRLIDENARNPAFPALIPPFSGSRHTAPERPRSPQRNAVGRLRRRDPAIQLRAPWRHRNRVRASGSYVNSDRRRRTPVDLMRLRGIWTHCRVLDSVQETLRVSILDRGPNGAQRQQNQSDAVFRRSQTSGRDQTNSRDRDVAGRSFKEASRCPEIQGR